jgi:membrane associated rhomboid family serine protease
MSYYRGGSARGSYGGGAGFGFPPVTPYNKGLMLVCGGVWVLQFLLDPVSERVGLTPIDLSPWLGLVPVDVLHGWVWQIVTYMFLHDSRSLAHVGFNLLTMWMFGGDLERFWGGRRYLTYWFVCGIGAGLAVAASGAWRGVRIPTVGASGAIFGLIVAYGTIFAERRLLWNFLFPIKARTLAWIFFAIAFVSMIGQPGDGISHVAHLGGMVVGWLYLKRAWRVGDFARELVWRVRRRRFKVVPPNERDPWVH